MRDILITTILFTLLVGCGSTKPTSLDRSLQEYHAGQWLMSELWAEKSIGEKKSVDESQYMMGLCEFKLQHVDNAEHWFEQASTSLNPEVRSKATAMLGIIASNRGDTVAASAAFSSAAPHLIGQDKLEARARTGSTRNATNSNSGLFTLQFGAYREKANAMQAMKNLEPSLKEMSLGNAWISEETDRVGRTMFLVQAGRFSSRTAASSRRKRGDLPQCIVTVSP